MHTPTPVAAHTGYRPHPWDQEGNPFTSQHATSPLYPAMGPKERMIQVGSVKRYGYGLWLVGLPVCQPPEQHLGRHIEL
jgi:hypothetical protein